MGNYALGLAAGLLAAAIWGGGSVVSRHLVTHQMMPVDLAILRYAGCVPVALGMWFLFRDRVTLKVSWTQLAVLLLLAGPPYHCLVITGYAYATAGAGAVLISGIMPAFGLAVPFLLDGEKPQPAAIAGTLAAMAGIWLFSADLGGGLAFEPLALAIFGAGALGWALLTYVVRKWGLDPLRLTNTLAIWSVPLLPAFIYFRDPERALPAVDLDMLLQVGYHGVLVAYVATLCFYIAVKRCSAPLAAALQGLAPGLAAVAGVVLLGESLSPMRAAGIIAVVVGVIAISRSRRAVPVERDPDVMEQTATGR